MACVAPGEGLEDAVDEGYGDEEEDKEEGEGGWESGCEEEGEEERGEDKAGYVLWGLSVQFSFATSVWLKSVQAHVKSS